METTNITVIELPAGAQVRKCRLCHQPFVARYYATLAGYEARCDSCRDAAFSCVDGTRDHDWQYIPRHAHRGGWSEQCVRCNKKRR